MSSNPMKRFYAVVLFLSFLLATILSATYVAAHTGHNHHNDHCTTCAHIDSASSLLQLIFAVTITAVSATAAAFLFWIIIKVKRLDLRNMDPISLRVRMNN